MKIKSLIIAMMCCLAIGVSAKDIRTAVFTTQPQMHCVNCETRIKENLRFEKGIKDIVTNLDDKTITVKYDADKTTTGAIIDALSKINYQAEEVKNTESSKCSKSGKCCGTKKCGEKSGCKKDDAKCGHKADSSKAETPACCK